MTRAYYPRAASLTAIGLSVVLIVAAWLGWQLLPANIRELFTGAQLATLVLFVLVMLAVMLGIGLSNVRVEDSGLAVRNGLSRRRIGWEEIAGFRMRPGDPWAYVELNDDPGSRPLIAVQRVDGARARDFVDQLAAEWERRRR